MIDTHFTTTLNCKTIKVNNLLKDFTIGQKPSSNVDFFGVDAPNEKIYVQFKGGSGAYIYSNISAEVLNEIENVDSIGRLISTKLVNKFPVEKFADKLISVVEIPDFSRDDTPADTVLFPLLDKVADRRFSNDHFSVQNKISE